MARSEDAPTDTAARAAISSRAGAMTSVFCVGHAVQDFVFYVDRLPDKAEKYRANAFETAGGGPAATAAVAISRLGGEARLAARVGDDRSGRILMDELEEFGVCTDWVRRFTGVGTSVSSVLVDARSERRIVNYLDPTLPTAATWLPDAMPGDIRAVLADVRWPEGAMHMLELARTAGIPGVLDGDMPLLDAHGLVGAASHAAFSEPGLRAYTGCEEPEAALQAATERTGNWCCVTLGERGALLCNECGEIARIPGFEVPAIDSLGAGDVWHGAFALFLAEGRDEKTAILHANAVAALKVGQRGARSGTPDRPELERFLSSRRAVDRQEKAT